MSQYREVVHINISENGYNVPIDSFKFYISGKKEKEKCVGIAKRKSGTVDFFYNYEHIDTSNGNCLL
jgi:hypothetical protein